MDPTREAIFYITKFYTEIGKFDTRYCNCDLFAPSRVILKTANDILQSKNSPIFHDKQKEHIAYSLMMVAHGDFLSSPAAVGSVYLITRFEYYFRILSKRLQADGKWKTEGDQKEMKKIFKEEKRLNQKRINSVALAYKIMKTNNTLPLSNICNNLDKVMFTKCWKMPDSTTISDIGERIDYLRKRSAHGHWADISIEAKFIGLLTTIVFYNHLPILQQGKLSQK